MGIFAMKKKRGIEGLPFLGGGTGGEVVEGVGDAH